MPILAPRLLQSFHKAQSKGQKVHLIREQRRIQRRIQGQA